MLLAHTQSEDENAVEDVTEQQRILEEENDGEEGNGSETGTITPGESNKMEVDESGSRAKEHGTGLAAEGVEKNSPLQSRSYLPTLGGGRAQLVPPANVLKNAASADHTSTTSGSSASTVISKPLGTGSRFPSPG